MYQLLYRFRLIQSTLVDQERSDLRLRELGFRVDGNSVGEITRLSASPTVKTNQTKTNNNTNVIANSLDVIGCGVWRNASGLNMLDQHFWASFKRGMREIT